MRMVLRGLVLAAIMPALAAAAPGSPDDGLAAALQGVRGYAFGQDRSVLRQVEALVQAAVPDPARRRETARSLAALLADPAATPDCRRFVCDQLAVAGTDAEVPALAAWLGDETLSVSARGALERIGGPQAAKTLREALARVPETQRAGIASSLGRLRDPEAVGPLLALVDPDRPAVAVAALQALAAIPTPEALDALMAARQQAGDALRVPWAESALTAADGLRLAGHGMAALPALRLLGEPGCPPHVRRAAFRVALAIETTGRPETVSAALRGPDPDLLQAALDALRDGSILAPAEAVAIATAALPGASAETQYQLLAVLEACGGPDALRAASEALRSPDAAVRCRAIAAVGTLGGPESVPLLVELASQAPADELQCLAAALSRLPGEGVDAAIAEFLPRVPPRAVPALAEALVNRGAANAVPALLAAAELEAEPATAAVKALGELGNEETLRTLVEIAARGRCRAPANALRQALTDIARRRPDAGLRAALAALEEVKESQTRAVLIAVLGALGSDEALAPLQAALTSEDRAVRLASVRALAGWPTGAPCETLVGVIGSPADPAEEILAARGVARMLTEDVARPLEARCALLARALAAAGSPEAVGELVKGAPGVPAPQTFELLVPRLAAGATSRAAAEAILALANRLQGPFPEQTAAALRAAAAECRDTSLQTRAELAHRSVLAGPNLARGAAAESRDGLDPDYEGRGPEAAVDGDLSTYWDDRDDQPAYNLAVTLAAPALVEMLAITGWAHHNYAPKDFEVVCDGRAVRTIENAVYTENRLLVSLPAVRCQTVELRISGYYGRSPAVRELELFGPASRGRGPGGFAWESTPGAVSLLNEGRTVWRFNHNPAHAKPFFNPVALADGTVLTWNAPPDHPWHHGLWFSWKLIDDVNYWEEDSATGASQGRTSWDSPQIETRDDFTAAIRLAIAYGPPGQEPVLREQRTIEVSAPAPDGGYRMDWTMAFTALADTVVLSRTPPPGEPGGVDYGGYAGLSVRLARDLKDWQVVNADGLAGMEGHRKPSVAMDFSGSVAGRTAGIAILGHPANLNAPNPWFVVLDPATPFGYFSPAVLCLAPHRMGRGESFTLRYRVLIHTASLTPARLAEAAADFAR